MRAVVMRVREAAVTVGERCTGAIGRGFLVLLGVRDGDGEAEAVKLADKICGLRIFEDENEKMNRSLSDVDGRLLVISQFTLYGSCKKGRRPDFFAAARPETAVPLYERFLQRCSELGFPAETGEFGAHMHVHSVNDGPVTLILDTETL